MTTKIYMGHIIRDCYQTGIGRCTGKGWYVQTHHHPSDIPYTEELCPHYSSLIAAQNAIREIVKEQRQLETQVLQASKHTTDYLYKELEQELEKGKP